MTSMMTRSTRKAAILWIKGPLLTRRIRRRRTGEEDEGIEEGI